MEFKFKVRDKVKIRVVDEKSTVQVKYKNGRVESHKLQEYEGKKGTIIDSHLIAWNIDYKNEELPGGLLLYDVSLDNREETLQGVQECNLKA